MVMIEDFGPRAVVDYHPVRCKACLDADVALYFLTEEIETP
jgi:hypothetical protein